MDVEMTFDDPTGAALAGDNLPSPPNRGSVERPDEFRWFTRDSANLDDPKRCPIVLR
jgi:hypothetical protein